MCNIYILKHCYSTFLINHVSLRIILTFFGCIVGSHNPNCVPIFFENVFLTLQKLLKKQTIPISSVEKSGLSSLFIIENIYFSVAYSTAWH